MEQIQETAYRYDAFISYRHVEPDITAAKTLHRLLERYRIPPQLRKTLGKQKMGKVFRDQEELPTSPDLSNNIEEALIASKWLIVICSPRLPLSRWCLKEIDTFIALGRRDRILILLIEGEPEESFPRQLRFVELGGELIEREPLAADIRADTTNAMMRKLRKEKLRLLAPMLEVGFDDLRQRAKAHFRQTLALGTAAALVLASITGGAIFYQWNQANTARVLAQAAQAAELLGTSQRYRSDGQRAEAVRAAAEALQVQKEVGLDTLDAQAALYNALVNFPTEGPVARLSHPGQVQAIKFSQDGSRIATLHSSNQVSIWEVESAKRLGTVTLPSDMLFSISVLDPKISEKVQFTFTKDGDLLLAFIATDGKVADRFFIGRYTPEGEEVFLTNTRMFRSSAMGIVSWDETGVIAAIGSLSEDEYRKYRVSSNNYSVGAVMFLDIETGEVKRVEWDSRDPLGINLSPDRDSVAALFAGSTTSGTALIFETDAALEGEPLFNGSMAMTGEQGVSYMGKTRFLISNSEGMLIRDVATKREWDVPGLERNEDSVAVHDAGPGGSFLAGYHNTAIYQMHFDGNKIDEGKTQQLTGKAFMGDYITNASWSDPENGIFAFLTNPVGDYYNRMVVGNSYVYQNYMVKFYSGSVNGVSKSGYIALSFEGSRTCEVYNVKSEPNAYLTRLFDSRRQFSPIHVDAGLNKMVLQQLVKPVKEQIEDGAKEIKQPGLWFELYQLDGGELILEEALLLEDTAGLSFYEDSLNMPYSDILWGEGKALLNRSESIWLLDLEKATLTKLLDTGGNLLGMNQNGFAIQTGEDMETYDFAGNKTSKPTPDAPGWRLWNPLGYSPKENLVLWPYADKHGTDTRIRLGFVDYDTGEYLTFADDIYLSACDALLWNEKADRMFLFLRSRGLFVFDVPSRTLLDSRWENAEVTEIMSIGGDYLAALTAENTIEFYDMNTMERVLATGALMGDFLKITYHADSGTAVVTTDRAADLYNLKEGVRATGTLIFPESYEPDSDLGLYLSRDSEGGMHLLYLSGISKYYRATGSLESIWCDGHSLPLFEEEELLSLVEKIA